MLCKQLSAVVNGDRDGIHGGVARRHRHPIGDSVRLSRVLPCGLRCGLVAGDFSFAFTAAAVMLADRKD